MGNVRQRDKFDTEAAWANLALSYRLMAQARITGQSRDRLLRMAEALENRGKDVAPVAHPADSQKLNSKHVSVEQTNMKP